MCPLPPCKRLSWTSVTTWATASKVIGASRPQGYPWDLHEPIVWLLCASDLPHLQSLGQVVDWEQWSFIKGCTASKVQQLQTSRQILGPKSQVLMANRFSSRELPWIPKECSIRNASSWNLRKHFFPFSESFASKCLLVPGAASWTKKRVCQRPVSCHKIYQDLSNKLQNKVRR